MTEQTIVSSRLHVSDEFDALMERLDAITPLLRDNAEANEANGRLTPQVESALHKSGVVRVGIPKSLGGYEFSPRQVIETTAKVSYADASTGWAFMALQMITGTTAAWLGDEAIQELFPDGNYSLIAGQGTRMGKATKVDGGYRLSGSWSFATGMHQASHIHTAALVEESGEALVFTPTKSP